MNSNPFTAASPVPAQPGSGVCLALEPTISRSTLGRDKPLMSGLRAPLRNTRSPMTALA
jgi:hypothetical protein